MSTSTLEIDRIPAARVVDPPGAKWRKFAVAVRQYRVPVSIPRNADPSAWLEARRQFKRLVKLNAPAGVRAEIGFQLLKRAIETLVFGPLSYLANELLRACRELGDPEGMATAHSMRAIVYLHLGEYTKVREELSRAEALSQHAEILNCSRSNLALLCIAQGSVEEGLRASEEAIRLDPKGPHAHFSRGLLLGMKDETSAAVEELRQAIQAGGDSSTHRYFLAIYLLQSGKEDEAVDGLKTLAEQSEPGVFKHLASARLDALRLDFASASNKIEFLVLGLGDLGLSGFPGELYFREAEAIQAICTRALAWNRFAGHLGSMSEEQLRIYRESMRAPLGLSVDPNGEGRPASG